MNKPSLWVDVKKGLPPIGVDVLITAYDHVPAKTEYDVACLTEDGRWANRFGYWYDPVLVGHWQALPPLPEEEE